MKLSAQVMIKILEDVTKDWKEEFEVDSIDKLEDWLSMIEYAVKTRVELGVIKDIDWPMNGERGKVI